MGWHHRMSRFMTTHHVFEQEADNSCGPSCALMLFQRARGVKLNAMDSYKGYDGYAAKGPVTSAYDGSAGTWYEDMARYIRNVLAEPTKAFRGTFADCTDFALLAVRNKCPALASIGWYTGGTRNNGHWVIFDKVESFSNSRYMIASDPGDGHLHVFPITKGQPFHYQPDYGQGIMNGILDGVIYFPNQMDYS